MHLECWKQKLAVAVSTGIHRLLVGYLMLDQSPQDIFEAVEVLTELQKTAGNEGEGIEKLLPFLEISWGFDSVYG